MSEHLIASTASKARRLTDEEIHEIEHEWSYIRIKERSV